MYRVDIYIDYICKYGSVPKRARKGMHCGSAIGFMFLQRFSVGLAVEYSSFFISVLILDLYICCLVHFR